jgi:glucose-fructose oxidoreductase
MDADGRWGNALVLNICQRGAKSEEGEDEMSGEEKITRRTLIGAAAFTPIMASASKALAQKAEGQPMMGNPYLPQPPQDRMRWAVVGLGSFAVGQLIPGLVKANRSRLTAVVSGNPEKAANIAKRYGVEHIYNYDNFDDIANNPEIDCVQIALPVGLHAEYTIRALKAGKHVLCEKPMAVSAKECESMIAAAKAANRLLGVGYRINFEPHNLEALRLIRSGKIGKLRAIQNDHGFQATPESWPPHIWRLQKKMAGGGSLFDIGIYGINTSLMMLPDDRPVEVSAVYSYPKDDPRFKEVEGGIDWRIMMESGVTISGVSSYCYEPYAQRQRYFGSKASLEMDPATTYYENNLVIAGGGNPKHRIKTYEAAAQFPAQVDAFSEAARGGTPYIASGEMGLRDLRIMEAMYKSADRGGAAVKL